MKIKNNNNLSETVRHIFSENLSFYNSQDKFSFEKIPVNQKGDGMSKRRATPGLWKKNLKQEEINLINKILGPTLTKLGYN